MCILNQYQYLKCTCCKMGNVFAHHFLTDVSHFIFNISEKQFSILPLHQELSASEYTGALSCCLMI